MLPTSHDDGFRVMEGLFAAQEKRDSKDMESKNIRRRKNIY
jgi:hypothetical protein